VHAAAIAQPIAPAESWSFRSRDAIVFLQVFAVAVMLLPSDTVFKPIGAAGYPAALIGVFIFGVFAVSVLLGFHDPRGHSHPIRGVLAVVWLSLLASYILMDRGRLTGLELAAADRILIRYVVITGVALVAAEWLRTLDDVMRVVRVLCWAGAGCGFVAVGQYWLGFDLSQYLRMIPGFVVNHDNPAILARGSLNRVQGTAITAIELGVVMGMLIPVATVLGLYDRGKSTFKRWAPLTLIVLGVATSVSRSAILAVVVVFSVLVVLLPAVPRAGALMALPVAVGAIFMSAHGLIGTLMSFFTGAGNDPSIMYRTHDYPVAEEVWRAAPWFGHGPGSWMPVDSLYIFDNQYLAAAVELGLIGILALFVFVTFPAIVALACRRWTKNEDLRLLCAALGAAALVAPACSMTFDSMAFPMFVNVYALLIGLIGACSRLAAADRQRSPQPHWVRPWRAAP
jgi:hypothetical protein